MQYKHLITELAYVDIETSGDPIAITFKTDGGDFVEIVLPRKAYAALESTVLEILKSTSSDPGPRH